MTRDFNKQRRNDSRPPFRNSSSPNRDERPSRQSRPRLNREVVDRAWESGAPQRHADYHPRDSRGQERQGGQFGRTPRGSYNNTNSSRANHQNNRPNHNSYTRSEYTSPQERNERRFTDRRQEPYQESGRRQGDRNFRDNRHEDRDTRYGHNGYREQRYESHEPSSRYSRQERRPNNGMSNRSSQNGYHSERSGFQQRDGYRSEERREYNGRGSYQRRDQRDSYNERSRPYQHHDTEPRRSPGSPQSRYPERGSTSEPRESRQAQFEGDYEWTEDAHEREPGTGRSPRSNSRPFQGTRNAHTHREDRSRERHVTPLPDGRVIKGSRPAQRRNARFWTEVSDETNDLLNQVLPADDEHDEMESAATEKHRASETDNEETSLDVSTPPVQEANSLSPGTNHDEHEQQESDSLTHGIEQSVEQDEQAPAAPGSSRRRTRPASAVVREKKEKGAHGNAPVTKPSQRGYKWPS